MTTSQCLPRPFTPEALHDRLQVEHLLDVARDELADLVDDEHQRLPGLPALHQLAGALGELARRDVGLVLDGLHPGVGHRVGLRLEAVHDAARLADSAKATLPFSASQSFSKSRWYSSSKRVELALLLEAISSSERSRSFA